MIGGSGGGGSDGGSDEATFLLLVTAMLYSTGPEAPLFSDSSRCVSSLLLVMRDSETSTVEVAIMLVSC